MPVPTISVEGRVVGDVQFKFTSEGTAVARFRMVAADRRQEADGTWVDTETFWITVTAFRKLAENVADSLRDRDAVMVIGKLSTSEWVDEGGQKRSAPKLIASSVGPSLFFLPRAHASDAGKARTAPARTAQAPAADDPWERDNAHVLATAPTPAGDDPWA